MLRSLSQKRETCPFCEKSAGFLFHLKFSGVDDFLIEPNRELHRRLVYNKTPHEYTERPGGHTWDYWENALPHHVLFFQNVLKANGSVIP